MILKVVKWILHVLQGKNDPAYSVSMVTGNTHGSTEEKSESVLDRCLCRRQSRQTRSRIRRRRISPRGRPNPSPRIRSVLEVSVNSKTQVISLVMPVIGPALLSTNNSRTHTSTDWINFSNTFLQKLVLMYHTLYMYQPIQFK